MWLMMVGSYWVAQSVGGGDNLDQHCMTMDLLDDDDENMELVNNGDGDLL